MGEAVQATHRFDPMEGNGWLAAGGDAGTGGSSVPAARRDPPAPTRKRKGPEPGRKARKKPQPGLTEAGGVRNFTAGEFSSGAAAGRER